MDAKDYLNGLKHINDGIPYTFKSKMTDEYTNLEAEHIEADNVLLDLLLSLGYKDIVNEYTKKERWYA